MKQIFTLLISVFTISVFAQAPEVYTMGADPIGSHNFNFYGAINANGANAAYSFVYSTDANFATSTTSAVQNKVIDTLEVIWATINGLSANTTYYYYLTATTANGTSTGAHMSFYSDSTDFLFANVGADVYGGNYGELHGKVNGFTDTYDLSFEFGLTPGTMNTVVTSDLATVSDANTHFFRGFPNGLVAGELYFFHVKATNASDTMYSDIRAFYLGFPYTTFEVVGATNITSTSADVHCNFQGFPVPVKAKTEIDGGNISHLHTPLVYFDYTTSLNSYTYNATGLLPEQNYYVRFKADTWIGNFYLDTGVTTIAAGINETNFQNTTLVYPNPTESNLTIEFINGLEKDATLQLLNLNGQLVKKLSIPAHQSRTDVSVSEIESGIYLLKLESGDMILYKKVTVVK